MPTFGRPGVYVTASLDALTTSTTGIPGSSIATFAGAYPQGPLNPTLINSFGQFQLLYGGFTTDPGNYLPFAVQQFFNNGGQACLVLRVPNSDAASAAIELNDVNTPPDSVMDITASSQGDWGNNVYVELISAGQPGRFTLNVYNGGSVSTDLVETFIDLSINPGDNRYVQTVVNSPISGSNFIVVAVELPNNTYSPGVNDPALISPTPLTGGGDGVVAPNLGVQVPLMLDTIQQQIMSVNLPAVDDPSTINTILAWAEGRGDVMMVIDGPAPTAFETSADVVSFYQNLVSGSNTFSASQYATLYAPWVLVKDPSSSINGATKWLPPGGAVLGVWDFTDNLVGPWQTPAGITYGPINVVDLEVRFASTDLDNLNNSQVNALKLVPGVGFCVFGGRTLFTGQPNRDISVTREVVQLTHDFTALTQFAIFQPNGPTLWEQITTTLTTYLTQQMQLGVFFGTTADEAFTVTCDSSNNTYATSIAGIVNVSVGVALASAAEFIVINIQQFTASGTTTTATQ